MAVGGLLILPADCETAIDALRRQHDVHIANSETSWLPRAFRLQELKKAKRAEGGEVRIRNIQSEIKNKKPK